MIGIPAHDILVVVVELTADAVEELEDSTGDRVWLIVKTSSIAVYG